MFWTIVLFIVYFLCCALLFAALLWVYLKVTVGKCDCKTDMTGKTVLITGGNSGIGYETAKDLARRNAKVIIACRNESRSLEAQRKIKEGTRKEIIFMKLDTSSTASVREFAEKFLKSESRLDVLINNAGRGGSITREETEEGFEATLATNHLGHFLLTHLLLDLVKKSAPSRIIIVSSLMHIFSSIDFNDFQLKDKYNPSRAYSNSKLLNIHFTKMLAEQLKEVGVTVNCLHPGLVKTNIFKKKVDNLRSSFIRNVILPLFGKSAEEGAQTIIHLAVAPDLEGVTGKYFTECRESSPSKTALDLAAVKKSWDISKTLLKLD